VVPTCDKSKKFSKHKKLLKYKIRGWYLLRLLLKRALISDDVSEALTMELKLIKSKHSLKLPIIPANNTK